MNSMDRIQSLYRQFKAGEITRDEFRTKALELGMTAPLVASVISTVARDEEDRARKDERAHKAMPS